MFDKFELQGIQVSMDLAIIIAIVGSILAILRYFKDNKEKLENEKLRDQQHRIVFINEHIEDISELVEQIYAIVSSAKGQNSYSTEQLKQLHEVHLKIWHYFNRLKLKLAINNFDVLYKDSEVAIERYKAVAEAGKPIEMIFAAKNVMEIMIRSCSSEDIAKRYLRDRFGS